MPRRRAIPSTRPKAPSDYLYSKVSDRGGHTSTTSPTKPRKYRFRDNGPLDTDDQRRVTFRDKLLSSVADADEYYRSFRKQPDELGQLAKPTRRFYESQNEKIDDWLEVNAIVRALADDVIESFDPRDVDGDGIAEGGGGLQDTEGCVWPFLPEDEQQRRRKAQRNANLAININVVANVILLVAKCIAAYYSSSLSLIASLVDSALDLLCTLIVFTTSKLVELKIKSLRRKFPVGRRRLEPIGILVFSVIMVISFAQILKESVEKLMSKGPHEAVTLPAVAIGAMAGTIALKGFIWIGCARVKTTQVQALAQDCKTDVYFNTLSLAFPYVGHLLSLWYLDPLGAGLLSLYIIYDWASTCFTQIFSLTGAAASDRVYEKLTFLAYRFSPLVNGYKNIVAYHAGDGVWVEVDILLDEDASLEEAHDVAETLQYCLEGLPEVDRAFVTCDYATHGPTGHVEENVT